MSAFEKAIKITLKNEGGFSNTKDDPGGATQFGITEKTLKEYNPNINIRQLDLDTAKIIYKQDYWHKCHCEEICNINTDVAILLFDSAVNIGTKTACQLLQQAISIIYTEGLQIDGIIGKHTLLALEICQNKNSKIIIDIYTSLWQNHYFKLVSNNKNLKKFIVGWLNRVKYTKSQLSS